MQVISNTAKFSNSEYKYLILRIERTSNKLQYLLVQWRVPTFAIICQVFSERNYNWLSPYCRSSIHKSFAFKPNKQRHEWVTYKLKLLIICKKLFCVKCQNTEFFLVRIIPHWTEYRDLRSKITKKTPYLDTFYAVCFQCSILKVGTNHSSCTTGLRSEIFNVTQLYKWSTTRFKFKCKTF